MRNLTLPLVALCAAFCLSAASPVANNKEIAMTKCTKDSASCEMNGDCADMDQNCQSNCSSGNCQKDQSDASTQVKTVRKSAAQKVVEGN